MTIKQQGGVFGRNPTFNDVTIEGQLTFDGDIDINSDLKVSGDIETTGNVIIGTSGNGIDFSATAGPNPPASGTSELLDDYEEGVWTPSITFGGGSVGITYIVQSGDYTKIGNLVTITGYVVLSSKGTSTGNVDINGLPFLSVNLPSGVALGRIDWITYTGRIGGNITPNSTIIGLNETTAAGVTSGVDDTNFSNASSLFFVTSYHTSA